MKKPVKKTAPKAPVKKVAPLSTVKPEVQSETVHDNNNSVELVQEVAGNVLGEVIAPGDTEFLVDSLNDIDKLLDEEPEPEPKPEPETVDAEDIVEDDLPRNFKATHKSTGVTKTVSKGFFLANRRILKLA